MKEEQNIHIKNYFLFIIFVFKKKKTLGFFV